MVSRSTSTILSVWGNYYTVQYWREGASQHPSPCYHHPPLEIYIDLTEQRPSPQIKAIPPRTRDVRSATARGRKVESKRSDQHKNGDDGPPFYNICSTEYVKATSLPRDRPSSINCGIMCRDGVPLCCALAVCRRLLVQKFDNISNRDLTLFLPLTHTTKFSDYVRCSSIMSQKGVLSNCTSWICI